MLKGSLPMLAISLTWQDFWRDLNQGLIDPNGWFLSFSPTQIINFNFNWIIEYLFVCGWLMTTNWRKLYLYFVKRSQSQSTLVLLIMAVCRLVLQMLRLRIYARHVDVGWIILSWGPNSEHWMIQIDSGSEPTHLHALLQNYESEKSWSLE